MTEGKKMPGHAKRGTEAIAAVQSSVGRSVKPTYKFRMPLLADKDSLQVLIVKAANQLASAHTAAEVLDARDMASFAYDASKKAARLAKAKGAHDDLIAKAHRAQADALEIEAAAKRRLADEYDAAQDRGEIRSPNQGRSTSALEAPSASDIGLSHKDIHDARQFRDAEEADPGIVRRTLDAKLDAGQEPTKAAVRAAVVAAARPDVPKRPPREPLPKSGNAYADELRDIYEGFVKDWEKDGERLSEAAFLVEVLTNFQEVIAPLLCEMMGMPRDPWPGLTGAKMGSMTKGRIRQAENRRMYMRSGSSELPAIEKLKALANREWLENAAGRE